MHCKIKVGLLFFSRWYLWCRTYNFESEEQARQKMEILSGYQPGGMNNVKIIPNWVSTDEHPKTFILNSWLAPIRDDRRFGLGFQRSAKHALIKKVFRFIVSGYEPEKAKV